MNKKREKIPTLQDMCSLQLVEDAVGIRTYGNEKVASVVTAIRILQSDEENLYNLMKKIFTI
jgi:hypothetical protein